MLQGMPQSDAIEGSKGANGGKFRLHFQSHRSRRRRIHFGACDGPAFRFCRQQKSAFAATNIQQALSRAPARQALKNSHPAIGAERVRDTVPAAVIIPVIFG